MHQVIGRINVIRDMGEGFRLVQVHLYDFDLALQQGLGVEFVPVPDATNHLMALAHQHRQQPLPYVPGRPGQQYLHKCLDK